MWIVLMALVGVCLVLSMFDRGDAVPSGRIDDPEAGGRESGLGGGAR